MNEFSSAYFTLLSHAYSYCLAAEAVSKLESFTRHATVGALNSFSLMETGGTIM